MQMLRPQTCGIRICILTPQPRPRPPRSQVLPKELLSHAQDSAQPNHLSHQTTESDEFDQHYLKGSQLPVLKMGRMQQPPPGHGELHGLACLPLHLLSTFPTWPFFRRGAVVGRARGPQARPPLLTYSL